MQTKLFFSEPLKSNLQLYKNVQINVTEGLYNKWSFCYYNIS